LKREAKVAGAGYSQAGTRKSASRDVTLPASVCGTAPKKLGVGQRAGRQQAFPANGRLHVNVTDVPFAHRVHTPVRTRLDEARRERRECGSVTGESYTGEALRDALQAGTLTKPPGLVIVGMVKPSATRLRSGSPVVVAMIETAEQVGSRPCDDHSHPVFRITLTEPADHQARVLAALLGSTQRSWERPGFTGIGDAGARLMGSISQQRETGPTFPPAQTCDDFCQYLSTACLWYNLPLCRLVYLLCSAGCTIFGSASQR
jgi:hypothetical protein